MPLSCECDVSEDTGRYCWGPEDFSVMPRRMRRLRCVSCNSFIESNSVVAKFRQTRFPKTDIECRIYDLDPEAITLASAYLCEECAGLYFSLEELGYCVGPYDGIRELVAEYAASNYQQTEN